MNIHLSKDGKTVTFIDDDGTLCPVTNMYDIWGDETDDLEDAVCIVAKRADDEWLTIEVTQAGVATH